MINLIFYFFTLVMHPAPGITKITVVNTGDTFTDDGGLSQNYSNCLNGDQCKSTSVLCSPNGDPVSIKFNSFSLFPGGDNLEIVGLYSSLANVSPVGKVFTSTMPNGCLTIIFTSTSIGASFGWDATITVINPPPQTPPDKKECNLVCKNQVTVNVGTFTPFDFIMNPGTCTIPDYVLEFMHSDGSVSNTITAKDRGTEVIYKVWIESKKNHCWGTVKVL